MVNKTGYNQMGKNTKRTRNRQYNGSDINAETDLDILRIGNTRAVRNV